MMDWSKRERKLKARVKELFLATVPRYYDHTLSVVSNMKKIMKEKGHHTVLVIYTAYLHDIGYAVSYGNDYVGNIEDQELKKVIHSQKGSELAREILEELEVEPQIINRISYLVSVHHREDIDDEDLKLLLQADQV